MAVKLGGDWRDWLLVRLVASELFGISSIIGLIVIRVRSLHLDLD
jgi:hypothetical protein